MHEFQTAVWMEAARDVPSEASRPVLSGRGRPLPASCFQSVRESLSIHSIVNALRSSVSCQLWSPTLALCRRRVVWIVLFARARVSSVLVYYRLALFMQAWSFALRTSCWKLMARFDSWSCWSILRFQLSPVKPFCLKPSEAPRRKPLVFFSFSNGNGSAFENSLPG